MVIEIYIVLRYIYIYIYITFVILTNGLGTVTNEGFYHNKSSLSQSNPSAIVDSKSS